MTSDSARERGYRDLLGALERHGIAWTVWDYKGEFGIIDGEGRPTLVQRVLSDLSLSLPAAAEDAHPTTHCDRNDDTHACL